jgi:hypothetical protein
MLGISGLFQNDEYFHNQLNRISPNTLELNTDRNINIMDPTNLRNVLSSILRDNILNNQHPINRQQPILRFGFMGGMGGFNVGRVGDGMEQVNPLEMLFGMGGLGQFGGIGGDMGEIIRRSLIETGGIKKITEPGFIDSLVEPPSQHRVDNEGEPHLCSVCMESIGKEVCSDSPVLMLPCLHSFHKECIIPWLNDNNKCPDCRLELPFIEKSILDQSSPQNNIPMAAATTDQPSVGEPRLPILTSFTGEEQETNITESPMENDNRRRGIDAITGMLESLFNSPITPFQSFRGAGGQNPPNRFRDFGSIRGRTSSNNSGYPSQSRVSSRNRITRNTNRFSPFYTTLEWSDDDADESTIGDDEPPDDVSRGDTPTLTDPSVAPEQSYRTSTEREFSESENNTNYPATPRTPRPAPRRTTEYSHSATINRRNPLINPTFEHIISRTSHSSSISNSYSDSSNNYPTYNGLSFNNMFRSISPTNLSSESISAGLNNNQNTTEEIRFDNEMYNEDIALQMAIRESLRNQN